MKPLIYLAAGAALAALFLGFPGIDRWAAGLFYEPVAGFTYKDSIGAEAVYGAVLLMEWLLYIGVAAALVLRLIPAARRFHVRWAALIYVALSFSLGPGLVTNAALKNEMGRARPHQTVQFGGTATFSPAFVPSDQCARNCAFVSGHAAFAFTLMTFVFLMNPGPARRRAGAGVIAFGALVGLGRMAQGGHWLSDIVFAALINIAIAWLLYRAIFRFDALRALSRRADL